ncbi:MAG: helix-turn-helix transcriptional regulator [Clostridia bacterium]|nr:helix-turn-helix transcriptional regulator [Clostridia bacterium]
MIIADKIIMLRKRNGWSQEELAEKLNVSRQSVSKWESGLSVPDLNKVIAMSTLFGVSTDYLLKDELEEVSASETGESDDAQNRSVSAEDANRYLDLSTRLSVRIALGVALCILSPVLLILLMGLADAGIWGVTEPIAVAAGLTALLGLIGVALALFIPAGIRLSEYDYLEKESFSLAYGVCGIVEKRKQAYAKRFRLLLVFGILMCVLCSLPLIIVSVFEAAPLVIMSCVCALLAICALGVFMIVCAGCVNSGFEKLLQTGDYTEEKKKKQRATEHISSAYWCIVAAGYLAVSFLTTAWHITWIVWPVAGCLWAAIFALLGDRKK